MDGHLDVAEKKKKMSYAADTDLFVIWHQKMEVADPIRNITF